VADLAVRLPAEKLGLTRFFRLDAHAPELTHYPRGGGVDDSRYPPHNARLPEGALGMRTFVFGLAALSLLTGCHHVMTGHNMCGGTVACAKDPCAPVDILSGRPNRPWQPLGVVQVRVDRGMALTNPTLQDAIPPLQAEARAMGADAVILTHEEFTSWYDKGEDASPIHDLERQETWYITEKGRFLSGLAVVYTGPCYAEPPPCPPAGPGMYAPSMPPPGTYAPPTPTAPSGYVPPPAPAPAVVGSPPLTPTFAPSPAPEAPPVVPSSHVPLPTPRRLQ
jgi:hypothetical protein